MAQYNVRNPAVKRILQEIKECQADTSGDFMAEALEDDIFEWHFTIRGPADSEFEGGIYHGRILLPAEYPFKPPAFMMLTPSGRFETGIKICLSISAHHPEHWQPSWSIRTALTALVAFMPTPGAGALGSLDYTKDERRKLVLKSRQEPPRWGNPDRQRLIEEMHARMLAAVPMAQASTSSTPVPVEAPAPVPAQPPAPAPAQPTDNAQPTDATATEPQPPTPTRASVSAEAKPPADNAPGIGVPAASQPTSTAPTATTPSLTVQTPATARDAPAQPIPPTTSHHAQSHTPQLRARLTATQATPAPTVTGHAPAAPRAAAPAPPPDTWALTVLAVALGLMILMILLRKAFVAAGYDLPPLTGTGTFTDGR